MVKSKISAPLKSKAEIKKKKGDKKAIAKMNAKIKKSLFYKIKRGE